MVVLDNASLHVSKVAKAGVAGAGGVGGYLYDLPAYSPGLSEIEPVFKQVKHPEIPQRSHTTEAESRGSVEQGFDACCQRLRPKDEEQLRPAA